MEQNKIFCDAGRRVIEAEAAALVALGQSLDDSFAAAVQMLLDVRGRVILSGMGKSG
ncbi:MAG: arabinose-5-phosphate isomerase, partial [Loktanella salsilacus]